MSNTRSGRGMRCYEAPIYIIGPWVARVLADHAWCTITRADEMKWNEMDEMGVEKWWNEICGRGKREKPREKPTQTSFHPPWNPHGGTETRSRDPSGGRRVPWWELLGLFIHKTFLGCSFYIRLSKGQGCIYGGGRMGPDNPQKQEIK